MLAYLSILNLFYDLRLLSLSHSKTIFLIEIMLFLACESSCFFGDEDKRKPEIPLCYAMILLESSGTLLSIRFSKILVFRPLNISHLTPSAKSQGSQVTWLDVIQSPDCEERFFSCYHDSRNNFVSAQFYSQIFTERANGMHQKKDVLAIVFLNMPFGTYILYQLNSVECSWRSTRLLCRVSLQCFSGCQESWNCVQQLAIFRRTLCKLIVYSHTSYHFQ